MIQGFMSLIGKTIYGIFGVLFWFIDLLQAVFYALAGVSEIRFGGTPIYSTNAGGEENTGLIYYLLTTPMIRNLLISIIVLAVFLLIIFTAMAFIKNAYASKQKNWQEIVGNAFKGLANFIFIPVCCLLGVWLSNILLVAINGATSTGGSTMMSRKLFICSAYNANIYRAGKNVDENEAQKIEALAKSNGFNIEVQVGEDGEYYAAIIDQVYAQGNLDIANRYQVEQHYNLADINYLILIAGGVFMLYVLVSIAYAMIKRMFILLVLFVISPALCSMYPLDEGKVVGSWKAEFIKYVISAYGAVVGMNLFFSILPIVNQIDVVSAVRVNWGSAQFLLNDIFQILIMISGLFVVKEFIGLISGWIGGDNALTTGENMKKSATGALKKYATGTAKTIGGAFKGIGRASAAGKNAKGFNKFLAFNGSLLGQAGKGILSSIDKAAFGGEGAKLVPWTRYDEDGKPIKNLFKQGEKAGKERIAAIQTYKDTEKQKNLFLKGDKKAGIKSGIDRFKDAFGAATTDEQRNEIIAKYFEEGEDSGVSLAELEKKAMDFTKGMKLGKDNKGNDIMTDYDIQDIRAMKRAGIRQLNRLDNSGTGSSSVSTPPATDSTIPSEPTTATIAGGRSHVEDTKMERQELNLLKDIKDHLATLISLQSKGQSAELANMSAKQSVSSALGDGVMADNIRNMMDSGKEIDFGKMVVGNFKIENMDLLEKSIDAYNSSIRDKKLAEDVVNETSKQLVETLKKQVSGNKEAELAIMKFKKAADMSADAVQKLVKEIENLLKK